MRRRFRRTFVAALIAGGLTASAHALSPRLPAPLAPASQPPLSQSVLASVLWVGAPLALLLLLALIWTWTLRRKVAERTRALTAELIERRNAEAALRESENVRARTEEISLVMVAHVSFDGRWLKVPPRLAALTGYTEPELLATDWRAITHPEDVDRDAQLRAQIAAGEIDSYELEKRYVRKDGAIVWVEINCCAVPGADGKPDHFLMYIRDISARKKTQEDLLRSEERYRSLVQATTSVVWTTNADGEFVEPQPSWEAYTGQTWAEYKGRGWASAIHPDDLESVAREWSAVLKSGQHHGLQGRLWRRASGEHRRFKAYGLPIRRPDGSIREWIGMITDIEDQLRAESALREFESRFRQMAESSSDVFWFADLDPFRVRYVNPAFERIWGERAEDVLVDPYRWQRCIHRDDLPAVAEAFRRFISGDAEDNYSAEYRVVRPDGEVRWVFDRGVRMRDAHGPLRQIAGIVSDITERKEAEQRQAFMMQELDHRVKNNLATVLSIVESTLAAAPSMEAFADSFRGRVMALARSHSALAESKWKGVSLRPLVEQTLSPYHDLSGASIVVKGESVMLPPAAGAAISMTLNELCTNAGKHGAFSQPGGRLEVSWELEPVPGSDGAELDAVPDNEPAAADLTIHWKETLPEGAPASGPTQPAPGGNGTAASRSSGLGLRLMQGLVEHELRGKISFDFSAGGLRCVIRFPLRREEAAGVLN